MNYPKWIPESDKCLWCNRFTLKVSKITVEEDRVLAKYECENKECRCQRDMKKASNHTYIYGGKGFVNSYKKFLEEFTATEQSEK